jgi:hypothetical protein
MAQPKNKDRKKQLENFKQNTKRRMSKEQAPEVSQIRSYPIWGSQEKLEISGLEWEAIYNALSIFKSAIIASESVMQRNTENGKITNKFVDENGKEVSSEKVAEYTAQMNEFFAKRAAEQAKESTPEPTSTILSETGEPVKKENKLKSV